MSNDLFARRTFLRGLGTALALPWLESALPRSAWGAAAAAAPVKRLAFLYVPNGVHMPAWRPSGVGADFELPPTLEPLAPFRQKLLVLSGLTADKARANGDGAGDHARSAAAFLTGAQPEKTDGKGIRAGVSVDQLAASTVGRATRFDALVLGCEAGPNAGDCDSGYSCAYSHNISWRTPTTPAGKEINPRRLFDRLFGAGDAAEQWQSRTQRDQEQRSVLDLVAGDARRLRRRLGGDDARKLDEYLAGVRDIERRIDDPAPRDAAGRPMRPAGIPADYAAHVRLMGDLLAAAFQTDLTRVATLMVADEGSGRVYKNLGIGSGHHDLSHHQGDQAKIDKIAQINRFHVELLAYVLARLDGVREGEGTLLDNVSLVFGSAISDGNRHNHDDLPILVAGGGGGTLAGGRHLRFADETPLMNLHLALLNNLGVSLDAVGDSTGPLAGLAG